MKKKISGVIIVCAITAVIAFNVKVDVKNNILSNVSLGNIEALATESSNKDGCYSTVHYNSALGKKYLKSVKYCGSDCENVNAHAYDGKC